MNDIAGSTPAAHLDTVRPDPRDQALALLPEVAPYETTVLVGILNEWL